MFEKFTERARRVMGFSRQEAQRLRSEFVGTEHMLLGILLEGEGVAAKVLKNVGIDYKRVRQQIEMLVPPPAGPEPSLGQLPFSPRSRKAIELAAEASEVLGHDAIGTEHLLIGLIEEAEGIAAQVLSELGHGPDEVRRQVLEAIGSPDTSAAAVRKAPWSDRTRSVVLEAVSEARAMKSPSVDPEHLLLAMLVEGGPLSELLATRGVDVESVRSIMK